MMIQPGVIDRLELEADTKHIAMTLVDELDWADEKGHINQLQDKLNFYLEAVESSDVFKQLEAGGGEKIPRNSPIKIVIRARHPMSPTGAKFFEYAKNAFSEARVSLMFRLIETI